MKKIYVLASLAFTLNAFAQNANVYPSNLNSGYSTYNASTTEIEGIYFQILSDGSSSSAVIPNFQTSLYLLPCDGNGNPTGNTPIIIQSFTVTGMNQLSSINYTDSVNLHQVNGLASGMYRLGIWVDSDGAIPSPPENTSTNAGLMQSNAGTNAGSIINYTSAAGIEKFADINEQITIYPNPAATSFQVSFMDNNKQTIISLYDVNGKLVLNQPMNSKATIDVSGLTEGVYNINIISNESIANKRLVIVK